MALFDPFMGQEMGRLLEWMESSKPPCVRFSPRIWEPAVDVFESGDRVEVWAELAGVKQENIGVSIDTTSLVIKGWRGEKVERPRAYYQVEIFEGPFERKIALPVRIDTERAKAFYDDGILKIVLPKSSATERTHHIQIKSISIS
jgi:HSP20 family protein